MKSLLVKRIWMPAATGTIYPQFSIPSDKKFLAGFAWFDYVRPMNKDDIFDWRSKSEDAMLKKSETKKVPLQRLDNIDMSSVTQPEEVTTDTIDTQ